MTDTTIEIYEPERAVTFGFRRPVIFLSASVPFERSKGSAAQLSANNRYLPPLRTEIRTAVVQLARFAFARDVQLVFGGHPAISPLVLQATYVALPSSVPRVFIFQSEYFHYLIPQSTRELAKWAQGRMLWTRSYGGPPSSDDEIEPDEVERSLMIMRKAMIGVPGLVGAVLIGGMDGVEEEAALWKQRHPNLPLYSLPGTGGAARIRFDMDPAGHTGGIDPKQLDTCLFPRVIRLVFEDMGLP